MLVACRLAGLSALGDTMQASTRSRNRPMRQGRTYAQPALTGRCSVRSATAPGGMERMACISSGLARADKSDRSGSAMT